MSQKLKEIALLEDVSSLPSGMQLVYIQLVSAIDCALTKLRAFGAEPQQLSEEFIEIVVTALIDKELSQQALEACVEQEFQKRILEDASCPVGC
ncbi:MAG: hypothetical protein ACI95C_000121 [Pseudohongiellaceae bacterium]|jgi:hypothetical protein